MLSLCMYTDTASHMFCDNCLKDQSYKHKKYEIYCPDERKEVSLAEMFEARDLVTILRDQYVECPNQPKCTVKLPLGQLENHYIECKEISSIKCTKCGQEVPSTLWIEHKTNCQVTCDEFTLKESDNRGAKRKPAPVSSASPPFSSSRKNKSTESTTAAASCLYPSSQRADATTGEFIQQFPQMGHASTSTQPSVKPKFPTSAEPDKTTCKHCERKVKESNMPRHLEVCYKIPVTCPYCEKEISKSDIKAHVEQCEREFEARKTNDAPAAASQNDKKSETCHQKQQNGVYQPITQPSPSYADVLKHGKGPKSNTTADFKRGAASPRQESEAFSLHRKQDNSTRNTQISKINESKQIGPKSSFHGMKGRASSKHCNNSREGTPVEPESPHEERPRYMTRSLTKKLRKKGESTPSLNNNER